VAAIKFGLLVNMQTAAGSDPVELVAEQVRMAKLVEELGWDGVFRGQHYLSDKTICFQPLPLLSYIAAHTSRIDLAVSVTLASLGNPVDLAEQYLSLDAVSGGRLILGVGMGYRSVEFAGFGVPDDQRNQRFRENVKILTLLLSGERVTVDFPWCKLDDIALSYRSVQRPRPPIWMAGNSDKGILRAARLADRWLISPHSDMATVARQLELYRKERERVGLPNSDGMPAVRELFCSTDPDVLERVTRQIGAKYNLYHAWGQDAVLPGDDTFDQPYRDLAQQRFIVGTPEECFRQLQGWVKLGINYLVFRSHWNGVPFDETAKSIELMSSDVLPRLRDL